MDNALRAALTWGFVCFILLVRTLPANAMLTWQVFRQSDIPVWPLVVGSAPQVLFALVPLGCFLLFRRKASYRKFFILAIPFIAWLASQFIMVGLFYFIADKGGYIPPYAEGFLDIIQRMLTINWFTSVLVAALTIVACSYAFWRECRGK